MRYVVLLVKRLGADGFEVFVFFGEADLSIPAGRYSPKLHKVLNEEAITDDFAMIVRLHENSPLWHKAVRSYQDFVILAGRQPLPQTEASA
jgi:hypothetical protein